ncbi:MULTISPECIES: cytochrome c oxidase accessory protein CcoG [unclassified Mesorhizobium]|uniref:cytochrome c oxidase accessory protein CcoG n=1 Tax=unclassified Mesorhizobium TaxID=325217 RepID=UPI000F757A7F|nr:MULTISPECIES: cytochrome c oxidase accessory protein CcoG [unclassified Mesorhizobium]AZO66898.1 cytochrome c oxidase accessory protein CcoG [Mesorhizobium sp. M6A.T.Cr.TU.016.01.1.1]RUV00772.1 cytochrome c oxidase accessory protein CcoG [Mesorhizobium sp. M6A.T.Cr.TU.017.01.1.1]RWP53024.1 MAG: cytochrome c oxidase accessory protein CcoG [Mesorhizobium sp.]RWQ67419.1 MAG: cytochrome c oxidase accessory protein CcoG [Mesorhizobium sp.]RWQ88965.1 MAG: cytochrome c oxidase accessory protein Cc
MLDNTQVERLEAEAVNSAKVRQPLYAPRKKIFPKRASGSFRRFKWLVMAITLGIYYLTPWLRWDRGPFAPDQAVLIDLANRRFYFFFIEIWPQEFYYVAGLLVMAGIGLFLITSTVGRAWCGYTCPQTVWVDLFLVVERAIEGDRNARIKLDAGPWTARKFVLRVSKHAIWLVIAAATGGAWIFYFADAPTLIGEVFTGTAAPVAYITIGVLTATTYTFGGLMREQVCTYMCPWPRIQAAMLDENSLTVTYNDWRGEPRSRHAKKVQAAGQPVGDCVDCNACVAVCPMGIDIRDGQQLECITCALCIDACDSVMDKLGKERGLISYATLSDYNANMAVAIAGGSCSVNPSLVRTDGGAFSEKLAHFHIRKIFRPRTFIYMGAWSAVGIALLYSLLTRDRLEVNVLHDRNPQFVTLSDGSIRNGYTVKLLNMIPEQRTIVVTMQGLRGAEMSVVGIDLPADRSFAVAAEPDRLKMLKVFVRQPADRVGGATQTFKFRVEDKASFETDEYTATFNAPEIAR